MITSNALDGNQYRTSARKQDRPNVHFFGTNYRMQGLPRH